MADNLDEIRDELRRKGRQREAARRRAAALSAEMEPLVRRAHLAGMSYRELHALTGLSVPTIQAMVRGERRW